MPVELDEVEISRAIVEGYSRRLSENLEIDVAVAGSGPSGLCCAYYLAKGGAKAAVFERGLRPGGGMPGGGMMMNLIVVQEEGKAVLDEFGVRTLSHAPGYYLADSLEASSLLCARAIQAGATVFNLLAVEDVMYREDRVCGVVVNWGAVEKAKLHVDPLSVRAKYVVDATGHPAEVARVVERKLGAALKTPSGRVEGEKPMWADVGEAALVENTIEVYPGLWVCGMAANAVCGSPRMGPVFGGMLLSGREAARLILEGLK